MRTRGFTLVELLIVIMIIGILTSIGAVAYWDAMEEARAARTRAQVQKIHDLLMVKWESYRTRPVPISTSGLPGELAMKARLNALRQLMRFELPDRITDVTDAPGPVLETAGGAAILTMARPAASLGYQRRVAANGGWSAENQQAECLFMIVASMQDGTRSGLDFFRDNEIGDTDSDGMREILDGWGRPIRFLRWAPGFVLTDSSGAAIVTDLHDRSQPDPFDALKVDPRWKNNSQDDRHYPYAGPALGQVFLDDPFPLFPLVFSAGPDGFYHVIVDEYGVTSADDYDSAGQFNGAGPLHYRDTHGANYANYTWNAPWPDPPWPTGAAGGVLWSTSPRNDPYVIPFDGSASCDLRIGAPFPGTGAQDNITNHTLVVR